MNDIRIGIGTDVHRLETGRPLIIGGVDVPSEKGAQGHSDADVLMHAVTDALLGALAMGDIGSHFPNTDDRWRNAASTEFVVFAAELVKQHGFSVANVDSVIDLEKPRLREYIDMMRANLAAALNIDLGRISVKAKSGEGLGDIGEGRSIRAQAIVLLSRN